MSGGSGGCGPPIWAVPSFRCPVIRRPVDFNPQGAREDVPPASPYLRLWTDLGKIAPVAKWTTYSDSAGRIFLIQKIIKIPIHIMGSEVLLNYPLLPIPFC